MGSGIINKINEFLCNPKNVKKTRNTRLEKCYGHVNIATAFFLLTFRLAIDARFHLKTELQTQQQTESIKKKN